MIRLTCASCQTPIEVDDAFAGGVCRCKHCGAIQTVPRRTRPATVSQSVAGRVAAGEEPKTLYSAKSRAGMSSHPSGLEELAEAVHGSGLGGSGLLNRPGGSRGPGPRVEIPIPPKKASKRPWVLAIVGLIIIGSGAAAYLASRGGPVTVENPTPVADEPIAEPAFATVPLAGRKVIYVLDRGDATAEFFPALKALTVASVRSLGPDRLFQVVLWDNGMPDAYPTLTPGYATAAEADKLAKWFDQVGTGRSTDALPSLKVALDANPAVIVLATGKSLQLDSAFADAVQAAVAARANKPTLNAFTLGETAADDPLRKIARATGGRFAALSGPDLATVAE